MSIDPIRVLIVDDHPMLREGLSAVINLEADMKLVGEAASGSEAVAQFRLLQPDVALMDLQMAGMDGIEAIAQIKAGFPKARIVVLTTYGGDAIAHRALTAGAVGYLLKGSVRKELLDAIRAVHAGRRYLSPELGSDLARHAGDEILTSREIEVLRLVAVGLSNKRIAAHLNLAEDTVKMHLKRIFAKLRVSDRTRAVTVAHKRGVIVL